MSVYHGCQLAFAGASQKGSLSVWHRENATPSWFQAIPPERVGLDGRYDYYGLQKRVEAALRECFDHQVLSNLLISQRGRVVILHGHASSREILQKLVKVAEQVEGAIRVETAIAVADVEATTIAVG